MKESTRDTLFWCVMGFASGTLAGALIDCIQPEPMTPSQVADVTDTAAQTEKCKAVGRTRNSYHAYDCCMIAAGLHPGAACPQPTPPDGPLPLGFPKNDGGAHD